MRSIKLPLQLVVVAILIIAASLILLTPTTTEACTPTLTQGSEGASVGCLQQLLTITGDYHYGEITNYFGPATEQAVQSFQSRNNIVKSGTPETTGYGSFGPNTQKSLFQNVLSVLLGRLNVAGISTDQLTKSGPPPSGDSTYTNELPNVSAPLDATDAVLELHPETDELVWETTDCKLPDGPIQMWRNSNGNTLAPISIPINFALKSKTTDGTFDIDPYQEPFKTYTSPQSDIESAQESRLWLMGFWTDNGKDVYSLAHQEWYPEEAYSTFVLNSTPPCREGSSESNKAWKATTHHFTSHNGGLTFEQTIPRDKSVVSNAYRLAIVAEPFGNKPVPPNGETRYGFFHPSNIVKEGDYYYFMVGVQEVIREDGEDLVPRRIGFMLWRTKDISQPRGNSMYQFWDGDKWTDDSTYLRVGRPFIFTHLDSKNSEKLNSDKIADYFGMYALKWSTTHKQWIIFGTAPGRDLAYFTTDSLASPKLSDRQEVKNSHNEGPLLGYSWSASYPTIIDPDSTGYVFQNVDTKAYVYYVTGINQGKGRQIRRMELDLK